MNNGHDEDGNPYLVCVCGLDDLHHYCSMRVAERAYETKKPVVYWQGGYPHLFEAKHAAES